MKKLFKFRGLLAMKIDKTMRCEHARLTFVQSTGEKICTNCGRTIYMSSRTDFNSDFSNPAQA
ncbi:MAG: hypothetical protein K0S53_2693 [Bacteroidetes bacterium]|jgi:hypothetical protein|nr:hypothetical protein [Bacteroidota bacterium]